MAKAIDANSLDALLLDIKNGATRLTVCSGQPLTFLDADTTLMLAKLTIAAADLVIGAGVPAGSRRVTMAAKAAIPVTNAGTGNHIALLDVLGSRIKHVTTAPAQALAAGGTVDVASYFHEQTQPT